MGSFQQVRALFADTQMPVLLAFPSSAASAGPAFSPDGPAHTSLQFLCQVGTSQPSSETFQGELL